MAERLVHGVNQKANARGKKGLNVKQVIYLRLIKTYKTKGRRELRQS